MFWLYAEKTIDNTGMF